MKDNPTVTFELPENQQGRPYTWQELGYEVETAMQTLRQEVSRAISKQGGQDADSIMGVIRTLERAAADSGDRSRNPPRFRRNAEPRRRNTH